MRTTGRALTARARSEESSKLGSTITDRPPTVFILLSTTVTSMRELVAMCGQVPDFVRRLFIHGRQVSSVLCFPL
ncbi:unnamed protein product [Ixodes pacificus]